MIVVLKTLKMFFLHLSGCSEDDMDNMYESIQKELYEFGWMATYHTLLTYSMVVWIFIEIEKCIGRREINLSFWLRI